jgi:uncharacterized protein YegP (UPF0339 family)
MPHFTIQQQENQTWSYQLLTSEGHILLTGTPHEFKQSCHGEILSVKMNSGYKENYEISQSHKKKHFFTLRSMGSQKVIGTSEPFNNAEDCLKTINRVRKEAESAEIK